MYYGPRTHKYEFTSPDSYLATKFYKILEDGFLISPEELYIVEPWVGYSVVSFWCTKQTRLQLEYTFRRYTKMSKLYLGDPDDYQDNQAKLEAFGYAIY